MPPGYAIQKFSLFTRFSPAFSQSFRPPFHKVFARLFQKAAGIQRAAPFGRHPQMAEFSIL